MTGGIPGEKAVSVVDTKRGLISYKSILYKWNCKIET